MNKFKAGIANVALKFISIEEKLAYMFLETAPNHVHPIVILPAVNACMKYLVGKLEKKSVHGLVHNGQLNGIDVSVIQTNMGSPNSAAIMESLKLCGCKTVVRADYCGGLQTTYEDNKLVDTDMDIGSIVIPKRVFLTEGTSIQYLQQYTTTLIENSHIHDHLLHNAELWKYPTLNGKYWAVDCDPRIYDIFTHLEGKKAKRTHPDLLWTTDSLFCEPKEAIDVWKYHGCNSIDMESGVIYLLGALFNIPAISVLGVSDLSDSDEYNLFKVNKIHPGILHALSDLYDVLYEGLPKIQRAFVENQ